jgi:hypothetical protein
LAVRHSDGIPPSLFQLTGIGAEVGGEHVRGFAEFGAGEKGILCAGVRFKF